jgi:ubiquinone/menaquinone biosynthesis C-methylase UbiE
MNHGILLKRILLIFWAIWFSVVFFSNLADALKGLALLPDTWAFASGNFKFIKETTARYGTSGFVNGVLFAGVIVWEGIASVLFWRAGWAFQGRNSANKALYLAFTASLLLWGAFLIADEIFIAYPVAGTHLRLFVAQLVTLMAIELLPEPVEDKGYRGMAMEGRVATWYAKVTAKSLGQFQKEAREIAESLAKGSSVLEVAPGPGYLSVEMTKLGLRVVGLDISHSFVKIAKENAAKAGASVDFQHGNVSAMPFADASFDFVICRAAFKMFSEPIKAINEMCRVLKPGGKAVIHDLDRLASPEAIRAAVSQMGLGWFNGILTKWIFKHVLFKRAYSQDDFRRMAAESMAGRCEIAVEDISLMVTFRKAGA